MTDPKDSLLQVVQSPLILSIDIGTSAVKTGLLDLQGQLVSTSLRRAPVALLTTPDGGAEINPGTLLGSVWDCIDRTLAGVTRKVAGVACCTLVSNVLGIDRDGNPATPIFIYADTRAEEDARRLKEIIDEEAVHQRTGCMIHSSYLPARFLWLKRTSPQLFIPGLRWMSLGEYLYWKLFGVLGASYSIASWSGLLNRYRMDWDDELLSLMPVRRELLSPLVDIDQPMTGLLEPFASRWPSLESCPWFPAVGDGAAANIGSGCVQPAQVALTMGSTTALRLVVPGMIDRLPRGLWSYQVDQSHTLLGGALSEGGNIYAWLQRTLRIENGQEFEESWSSMPPDQHGLTFLPALAGERSPGWRGDVRGMIAGLSLSTGPVEIFRAALEGVACRISLIYKLLKPFLSTEHRVIANGGALMNSPDWVQMIADALGHPVFLSAVEETSLRGAALLALWKLGLVNSLDAFPPLIGREFLPNPDHHLVYEQAAERQQRLYGLSS